MRRVFSILALLMGMVLAGSVAGVSSAKASPVTKSALSPLSPISETAQSGLTEVRRRGRRGWKRGRGYRRGYRARRYYGRRGYRGYRARRYYGRRGYRGYRKYRRYRRHRNRDIFIGSLLGLGLAAPYYYGDDYGYRYRRRGGGRCDYWARRCANNWGYGGNDYYGCLRYHGCR